MGIILILCHSRRVDDYGNLISAAFFKDFDYIPIRRLASDIVSRAAQMHLGYHIVKLFGHSNILQFGNKVFDLLIGLCPLERPFVTHGLFRAAILAPKRSVYF